MWAISGSFDCADHDDTVICFAQDDEILFSEEKSKTTTKAMTLAEEEFFGAEFFYGVAEFGGFFEFEFFGGFAHVGFQFVDVGV